MLHDEDIELVKSSVSMAQLVEYYGFKISRKGYICCPFHNEKTPSMKVYSGSKGYYCFGCGAGGSIFNFSMEYENIPFEEAVRKIASIFSIPISDTDKGPTAEEKREWRSRMITLEMENEIQRINRIGMNALSDKIQLYECLIKNARPYGDLFCYLANRLPILKAEWEWRFELMYGEK